MSGDEFARRFEVVAETRRRWSRDEKLAIVEEASRPCVNISAVARRHGIKPALVYRWKKELGAPPTSDSALVPVIVPPSPVESPPAQASQAGPSGSCAIEIMLANGRRLKVSAGIAPTTLKQLIAALEA